MAYDETKITRLAHLKALAERSEAKFATKKALAAIQQTIDGIVSVGGQANVLEGVKVNGETLEITEKIVDILIATGAAEGAISVNGKDVAVNGYAALKAIVDTLNGTGTGSVEDRITAAINDFATKVSDDAVVNTYKELIDYAAEHGAEFTTLVGTVTALGNKLEGINTTVVAYVAEEITKLNLGQYATTEWANQQLANHYTKSEVDNLLDGKVDKQEGYGLSKNDFTDALLAKLNGISAGANKVAASETNGNLVIDGVETQIFAIASDAEVTEMLDAVIPVEAE